MQRKSSAGSLRPKYDVNGNVIIVVHATEVCSRSSNLVMRMYNSRIKIRENSWMARLAARKLGQPSVAITIGNTIHLYRTGKDSFLSNERWVKHELKHVEQFRRYGYFRFMFMYLAESIRKGYYNNRFEVEARKAEDNYIEIWS